MQLPETGRMGRPEHRARGVPACPDCGKDMVASGMEWICVVCGRVGDRNVRWEIGMPNGYPLAERLGSRIGDCMRRSDYRGLGEREKQVVGKAAWFEPGGQAEKCARIVRKVCEKLDIPDPVRDDAIAKARRVSDLKFASAPVTAAYSIVYAFRATNYTAVHTKRVIGMLRDMNHRIGWHSVVQMALCLPLPDRRVDIGRLVDQGVSRLRAGPASGVPAEHWHTLTGLAKKLVPIAKEWRAGADPSVLASLVIYTAERLMTKQEVRTMRISQRLIASVFGVSSYPVREAFSHFIEHNKSAVAEAAGNTATRGL